MFLASHCLLYASCDRRREGRVGQDGRHSGPVGTYFGRRDCSATDCLLAQPRGGQWFWSDRGVGRQSRDGIIVRDNTKVFFICGDNPLEVAHCRTGKIVPSRKLFDCYCEAFEEDDSIQCSAEDVAKATVEGGTECFKMCKGEVYERSACEDGEWTVDLSEIECAGDIFENGDDAWTFLIIILSVTSFGASLLCWVICLAVRREKSYVSSEQSK